MKNKDGGLGLDKLGRSYRNRLLSKRNVRCECTVCGRTFSTERTFDRHRVRDPSGARRCASPEEVGLEARHTEWGVFYVRSETTNYWADQRGAEQ